MKKDIHSKNWILDAVLFAGLCIASILELTGVALHQWLGIAVGILAGYHFLSHWEWVKIVTARWFGRTSNQARHFYLIDMGLLVGFGLILVSGLAISTWLSLNLSNYQTWYNLHVAATIITISLVVIKIAAHWRWVVKMGQRMIRGEARSAERHPTPSPVSLQQAKTNMGRRDFLKLMSIVSAAAVVASFSALDHSTSTQNTSANQNYQGGDTSQLEGTQNNLGIGTSSTACSANCPRGCSYPGHCRRYVDSNQNNRCDFGECT